MSHPVLTALGLQAVESGTYLGHGEWSKTNDAGVIEPVNPTTGDVLGRVHASSKADYDTIVERAQAAFKVWRTTPAPRRGEAIRLCADALRVHKDALGSLVALGAIGLMFGPTATSKLAEFFVTATFVGIYVVSALGLSTIYQATAKLTVWKLTAQSLRLSDGHALDRVKAGGAASSPFGEGLADALNVGGL